MTATDTPPETHDGRTTGREPILGYYEGQPIDEAGVTINNASGGLHDAVEIDPVRLEVGAVVHVVLRCTVRPPQFDPVDKANVRGPLRLVNRLHAEDATFVDEELVGGLIDEQRARIEEAKEVERQREKDGVDDRQMTIADASADGPRGGEPETVGAVLDSAIDLAQLAEDTTEWRLTRTRELDAFGKDDLVELASSPDYDIKGRHAMTKSELVDAIVDREAESMTAENGGTDG